MTDLFGEPINERPKREESKADIEKRGRINYQRRSRHATQAGCYDCYKNGKSPTGARAIAPAAYTRTEGAEQIGLCFGHKQERQDKERLSRDNH